MEEWSPKTFKKTSFPSKASFLHPTNQPFQARSLKNCSPPPHLLPDRWFMQSREQSWGSAWPLHNCIVEQNFKRWIDQCNQLIRLKACPNFEKFLHAHYGSDWSTELGLRHDLSVTADGVLRVGSQIWVYKERFSWRVLLLGTKKCHEVIGEKGQTGFWKIGLSRKKSCELTFWKKTWNKFAETSYVGWSRERDQVC